MRNLLLILSCGLLISCSSVPSKINKLEKIDNKITQTQTALKKNEQVYVQAAVTALKKRPVEFRSKEENLAIRMLDNTQEIIGTPAPSMQLNVDLLLADNKAEVKKLEAKEKEDINNKIVAGMLAIEKDKLKEEIIKEAGKLAEEHNNNIWTKVKFWGGGFLGLAAIGTLLYFFGPILIPIFGVIISGIKSFFNLFRKHE